MRWSIRGYAWNDKNCPGGYTRISATQRAGARGIWVVLNSGAGGANRAMDCAVQSDGAGFAGAIDGADGAALDGDGRTRAGHRVTDYFWDAGFDAGQHLRGVWRGDYRFDDRGGGRLFRRMAGSVREYRADQCVFVVPWNFAGDCVRGVSGTRNQQGDSGASGDGLGWICAAGACADPAGQGNGVCIGSSVAGRDARTNFSTASAAEYFAARAGASDDCHGRSDPGGINFEFFGRGGAGAAAGLGGDAA